MISRISDSILANSASDISGLSAHSSSAGLFSLNAASSKVNETSAPTVTTTLLDSVTSNLPYLGENPVISGSNIFFSFVEHNELIVDVSHNSGKTFVQDIVATGHGIAQSRLTIAADGDPVIAWQQRETDGNHVFFASSTDQGASFSAPVDLGQGQEAQIAASGEDVTVAFISFTASEYRVPEVVSSIDGGATLATPQYLSTPSGLSQEIYLATSGNNDYVVWEAHPAKGTVFVEEATSNNAGSSFNPTINLDPHDPISRTPIVTVSKDGNVNIVFRSIHHNVQKVMLDVTSTNDGASFSSPAVIATGIRHADILAVGNKLDAIYLDEQPDGIYNVMFTQSLNDGATWSTAVNVSGTTGPTGDIGKLDDFPWLWAENGQVTIAWTGSSGVEAAVSDDKGASFSDPLFLGAGNNVNVAGDFVLWLNAQDEVELSQIRNVETARDKE